MAGVISQDTQSCCQGRRLYPGPRQPHSDGVLSVGAVQHWEETDDTVGAVPHWEETDDTRVTRGRLCQCPAGEQLVVTSSARQKAFENLQPQSARNYRPEGEACLSLQWCTGTFICKTLIVINGYFMWKIFLICSALYLEIILSVLYSYFFKYSLLDQRYVVRESPSGTGLSNSEHGKTPLSI